MLNCVSVFLYYFLRAKNTFSFMRREVKYAFFNSIHFLF
nr:MAG TPA: hypothetical protein [Caudoviricetes sp.]